MATLAAERWPVRLGQELRLLVHVAGYEMGKVTVFRSGFVVREVLRGVTRPAVMVLVYLAIFDASGSATIGTWSFPDLVRYLILSAALTKVVMDERALDLGDQIFEGTLTKFLVMPTRYFTLVLGRFLQFTGLQLLFATLFWLTGALLLPQHWPVPASPVALVQALVLVLLAGYCQFLVIFAMNCLAFWLNQVWSLLNMVRFVTAFASGFLIPVSLMPQALRSVLECLYPYWNTSGPAEILLGRLGTDWFLRGLATLLPTILLLQLLGALIWRRGLRQYAGAGA